MVRCTPRVTQAEKDKHEHSQGMQSNAHARETQSLNWVVLWASCGTFSSYFICLTYLTPGTLAGLERRGKTDLRP